MNIRFILYILGSLMLIESALLLLPAGVALLYGEQDALSFLLAAAVAAVAGGLCWMPFRRCKKDIGKREGYLVVSSVWVIFSLFGSLPFMFSGQLPSFTDAFFESISGFTTTGCTVVTDVEALSRGLLFWRALSHFTGGIGILVLIISILPIFGVGSMNIYQLETSNAATVSRLSPKIKDTAKYIFVTYLIFTVLCFLCYLPEMDVFDAVCHAFSTTATGGFSTRNASLGAFSPYSQYVSMLFMLLAGVNFTLYYLLWKRDYARVFRNDELKFYLIIMGLATAFVVVGLWVNGSQLERGFREGAFHLISVMTTTGYSVNDFAQWAAPLWYVILMSAFIGGCAGSTAGGMKVVRFLLLNRMIPVQFKRLLHQRGLIQVKLNGMNVSDDQMSRTMAYLIIFIGIFMLGLFVMLLCGLDLSKAIGAVTSCLSNSGQGLGIVEPSGNFSSIPVVGKWICSALMLLGRLELYSVLILFTKGFWKE